MNYKRIYLKIILHAKSEEKLGLRKRGNGNYFECHHILPKSLFPLWVKRKSNMVLLTAREHFFCHLLLIKIYPCNSTRYAAIAFQRKSKGQQRVLNSKDYQYLKKLNSEMHKRKPAWNKGIPRTEELKQKLRKPHPNTTGVLNPSKRPEVRKKISESKLGPKNPRAMHWIIKNVETGEIWDFIGGFNKWARKQGFNYIGTLRRNRHPKFKILLSEKAS